MLNRYYPLALALLLVCATPTAQAQKVVEPSADPAFYLNNVIAGDTTATGERAETHYILRSGGIYLTNGEIENEGWPLTVEAEAGATARPQIVPVVGDGGDAVRPFTPRGDLTIRGLYITGMDDLGAVVSRIIRVRADNARVIVENCHLDYAGQSAMRFDNENNKLYVRNSIFSNLGRMDSPDNGRTFDMRGNGVDSVVVENNTFYNVTSRPYRSGGGFVNVLLWNHNTMVNLGQRIGSWEEVGEFVFTNNTVINGGFLGTTRPDDGDTPGALMDVDSLDAGVMQRVLISHNNFWNDPTIVNQLTSLDNDNDGTTDYVMRPLYSGPAQAFVDESGTASTNISEEITFTNFLDASSPLNAMLAERDGNDDTVTDMESRDNPFVDGAIPAYDFAYAETTASFTASQQEQPLGALTWFGLEIIPPPPPPPAPINVTVNTAAALEASLAIAGPGSMIMIGAEGDYVLSAPISNEHHLMLKAAPGLSTRPRLTAATEIGDPMIRPRADIMIEGLELDGAGQFEEVVRVKDDGDGDIDVVIRDSEIHSSRDDEDLVRLDVVMGNLVLDGVIMHNAGRRILAFRSDAAPDTVWVRNSTIYNSPDRMRLEAAANVFIFDGVTVTDIGGSDALDMQVPFPEIFIRNSLFFDNSGEIDIDEGSSNVTIENTNVFPLTDAFSSTAEAAFNAGTGNFSEDPRFEDAANGDFSVSVAATQTVSGSSTGGQVGDPRWGTYGTVSNELGDELPTRLALHQNYPNPFNPSTTLRFDLPAAADVTVTVYDVLGRQVLALPTQALTAGFARTIAVDASALSSGMYLYRIEAALQSGKTSVTAGTMTLLK